MSEWKIAIRGNGKYSQHKVIDIDAQDDGEYFHITLDNGTEIEFEDPGAGPALVNLIAAICAGQPDLGKRLDERLTGA